MNQAKPSLPDKAANRKTGRDRSVSDKNASAKNRVASGEAAANREASKADDKSGSRD